jgi:hypothetical protein
MSGIAAAPSAPSPRSVFAGADVSALAGFSLPDGAAWPMLDHDVWDFTEATGLPVQLLQSERRFVFTEIIDVRWRLVAKELIVASWPRAMRRWRRCPAPIARPCTSAPPVAGSASSDAG